MNSDASLYAGIVLAVTIGLAALVYGMQLSAGQSMNAPAIAGGAVVLAAIGVLVLRVASLPAHE